MDPVLLTGGTGIIGSSLARALVARGRRVRALVRSPERGRACLPGDCELVVGDVTDPDSVQRAVAGCRVVYHAAGLPEQWLADPGLFRRVNVDGTRHVAEAALAQRAERFVYTSTIDVFSSTPGREFDETSLAAEPKATHYQRSKQEADRLVAAACARGLPAVFLHPSAVFGPAPAASPGLNDFIAQLVRREVPMLLPGGMPVVYSDDVASGHLLAEEHAVPGGRYILSESYWELGAIARAVCDAVGSERVPRTVPGWVASAVAVVGEAVARVTGRPPLIPRGQLHFLRSGSRPTARHARDQLGWRPRTFPEALKPTLEYLAASGRL